MTGVGADLLARLAGRVVRATPVGDGRVTFELAKDVRPEAFVAELAAAGASVVSVNPLHTSLEEVFVQHVAKTASAREGALA